MSANVGERVAVALSICSHLHISENWRADHLFKYSYYWLNSGNHLIIGWDNAPHHERLPNYPHHKHSGQQSIREPSGETNLEQVLMVIRDELGTEG
jgi:hypothetical protein